MALDELAQTHKLSKRERDAIWGACVRKINYSSMEEAEKMATTRSAEVGYDIYAYECRWCRGWHLSKQKV